MVFYTDKFIPKGSIGCARGPFIFIRPKYKDDIGLLVHEKTHVKQFWKNGLIFHGLLYTFVDEYRLRCELEAYYNQSLECNNNHTKLQRFATVIATKYNIDITPDEVMGLFKDLQT